MCPGTNKDDGLRRRKQEKNQLGKHKGTPILPTVSRQPSTLFIMGTASNMAMTKAVDLKVLKVL